MPRRRLPSHRRRRLPCERLPHQLNLQEMPELRLENSAGSLRWRNLRLPSSKSLKRRSQSRKRLFSKKSTKRRSRGSWTAHQAAPRLRPHHRQGRGVLRTHQGGGAQSSECGGLQAGPPGIWAGTRQPGHFDQGCQLTVVR